MKSKAIQKTNKFSRFIVRISIVTFWLGIITGCLYLPKIFDFLFADKRMLHFYVLGTDLVPTKSLDRFTKKTGIRVRTTYFQTNEELLAKLTISKGRGYDVIVASDYMVELLRNNKLLKKINKGKLKNLPQIDSLFLGHFFDKDNEYSAPFCWTIYGIAVNKKFFKDREVSNTWEIIFGKKDRSPHYKVTMIDEAREAIFFAALYEFGKTRGLTSVELDEIEKILIRQKSWVESYTDDRMVAMLESNIVPAVIATAALMYRSVVFDDIYDFIIPREGTLATIENLAVPIGSTKEDLAHELLDFLLSAEAQTIATNTYYYNPVNMSIYERMPAGIRRFTTLLSDPKQFEKIHLLFNDLPLKRLEHLWLSVKAA